jgi:hypothetical protein
MYSTYKYSIHAAIRNMSFSYTTPKATLEAGFLLGLLSNSPLTCGESGRERGYQPPSRAYGTSDSKHECVALLG